MKKTLLYFLLTLNLSWTNAQAVSDASALCEKFIQKGISSTENKLLDGRKIGYWAHYYDDDNELTQNPENATSIFIVNYAMDTLKGICTVCYTNSKLLGIGTYLEDPYWIENGIFTWFDKNGTIYVEETFVNGKLNGRSIENYKNGKIQYESNYFNGSLTKMNNFKKDGTLIGTKLYSYTPDTIVALQVFRKDGSVVVSERQVNGKEDGDYFIYYKDGSIKLEAQNIQGIRVLEKLYDKKGNLKKESNCSPDGSKCTVKTYSKKGKIKKEASLKHRTKSKIVM